MSVHSWKRGVGKFAAVEEARELAAYTLHITGNQKVFETSVNTELIGMINDTAIKIYTYVWTANSIRVGKDTALAQQRLKLQQQASLLCDTLYGLIELAQITYHLKAKRMAYWSGKITKVRNLINSWHVSDKKRYARME